MADGCLNFDTNINSEGFEKGLKSLSDMVGDIKPKLKSLAMAVTAAFSVKKLVDFGRQSIETASDLAEVQNVVDTAFGESKQKMEDFADTAVKTYGISKLTAKQTGSNFMAMAAGMGLANDSASDMAVALTGLSADMASFYNVGQDVASTALKSIFTGETETLKQFGIVMTDANLQAYALSKGITKSTADMSQAEKVQLRYNYVMSQTALAQGDFAKTSDSWANQTRILSEQWKEFGATIGTVLMNVLLPAVKAINSLLSQLISLAQGAARALSEAFGFELSNSADEAQSIVKSTSQAVDNYSDIANDAKQTQEAQEGSLASFDQMNKLNDESKSDSTGVSGAGEIMQPSGTSVEVDTGKADKKLSDFFKSVRTQFEKLADYLDKNFKPIFADIWSGLERESIELAQILGGVFSDIKSLSEPLKAYFINDFTPLMQTAFSTLGKIGIGLFDSFNKVFSDIWNVAVFPILQNFLTVGLPLITDFNTQVWNTLGVLFDNIKEIFDTLWNGVAQPVLNALKTLWCDTWQSISDFWNEWGQPIFDGINEGITTTKNVFLNLWETVLKPVFDELMGVADSVWTEHLKPLLDEFLDFVGTLITSVLSIYNKAIAPVVNWLVSILGPIVSSVLGKIIKTVGNVISNIIDAVKNIISALKGVVLFITGVFTGDWKKAWQGVKKIFKGVWDALVDIAKTPINLIIGLINGLTGAVEDALNWIIDGINELSFTTPDWLPGDLGGQTFGFDLSQIDIPEIPKLAQGAVIPPNSEFLAVLGDQKRGTNIEAPLDTITQAVLQALVSYGGAGGNQKISVTIPLTLNGRTITQIVIDDINDYIKRNGRSPIRA
nr:MAG TPA: minor tail protein [Caudoviricetes sp.]